MKLVEGGFVMLFFMLTWNTSLSVVCNVILMEEEERARQELIRVVVGSMN